MSDRTVKELLDNNVPYSEMTESEIAAYIDYKAEEKSLSATNTEIINAMNDYNSKMLEQSMLISTYAQQRVDNLVKKLMGD